MNYTCQITLPILINFLEYIDDGKWSFVDNGIQIKVKADAIEFQVTHFSCFAAILTYFFGSPTLCMEMHAYLHPPSVKHATEVMLILYCVRKDEAKVRRF